MASKLVTWINAELERRGWSQHELARRSGLDPSTISLVLAEQRNAGFDFCVAIARPLGVDAVQVLRWARLLPPLPPEVEAERQVLNDYRSLSAGERQLVRTMLRALAHRQRASEPLNPESETC